MSLLPLITWKIANDVSIDGRPVVEVTKPVDAHRLGSVCINIGLLRSSLKGAFIQPAKTLDVTATSGTQQVTILPLQDSVVMKPTVTESADARVVEMMLATYGCHHGYSAMTALNGGLETPPYMIIWSMTVVSVSIVRPS